MIITPWTDEERAAYLDCPECGEPAIPASSVDRKNGRLVFQWKEGDGVVKTRPSVERMVAEIEEIKERAKVRPLKMAMPEGWNTTPDGPYEGE